MLAVTSVFLRTLGVFFNVFITNKIGAAGIGLYSLILSVYAFSVTLANSGVTIAVTRVITEELTENSGQGIKKTMHRAFCYSLFFGCLSGGLLFFFAPAIGTHLLSDARSIKPLYCLSVSLPFIAVSSGLSGYFTAVRNVMKSASAQVFELFIKMALSFYLLSVFSDRGIEYACIAVVLGGSISEILSCSFLFLLYRFDKQHVKNKKEHKKNYAKRLLSVSLPVALSAYLRSGLVTVEHLLIPAGLKKHGAGATLALSQYGVIHGMSMPVLLFPASILAAFSSLLVPELTEFQTRSYKKSIDRTVSRAFSYALTFSIFLGSAFFVFAYDLGFSIYKNGDSGLFMRFLAPLVPVMYLDSVTDAMLKGLNQQAYSMRYNLLDSAVSVILIYTLLPPFGVNAYLAVIYITELLNAFLSVQRLIKITNFRVNIRSQILLPLVFSLVFCYVVRFFMCMRKSTPLSPLALCIAIILSALFYLISLFFARFFPQKEAHGSLFAR